MHSHFYIVHGHTQAKSYHIYLFSHTLLCPIRLLVCIKYSCNQFPAHSMHVVLSIVVNYSCVVGHIHEETANPYYVISNKHTPTIPTDVPSVCPMVKQYCPMTHQPTLKSTQSRYRHCSVFKQHIMSVILRSNALNNNNITFKKDTLILTYALFIRNQHDVVSCGQPESTYRQRVQL